MKKKTNVWPHWPILKQYQATGGTWNKADETPAMDSSIEQDINNLVNQLESFYYDVQDIDWLKLKYSTTSHLSLNYSKYNPSNNNNKLISQLDFYKIKSQK